MKYGALGVATLLTITACSAPGRRAAERRVIRPTEVSDFHLLYAQNCSGCHGADGQGGLTVGVGDPVYLAFDPPSSRARVKDRVIETRANLANAQTVQRAAEDRLKQGLATLPDVLEARSATAQAEFDLQVVL